MIYSAEYRGGIGILVDDQLKYREQPDLAVTDAVHLESLVIELKTNERCVLIATGYRPLNGSQKEFLKEYETLIKKLTETESSVILGLD